MLPFPPVFCLRGKKVKRLKIYTPENWPLEEEIPIKNPSFSDSMLLFRGAKKVIPNPSPISPFLHLPNGSSDPWRLKNHDIARVEKTVVTIRFVSNLSIKKGVKTKCVKKNEVHYRTSSFLGSFVPCIICFWLKRFYVLYFSDQIPTWMNYMSYRSFSCFKALSFGDDFHYIPQNRSIPSDQLCFIAFESFLQIPKPIHLQFVTQYSEFRKSTKSPKKIYTETPGSKVDSMDCLSTSNIQLNKTSRNLREGTRSRQRPDQTKGFQRRCWERAFGRRRCWDLDPKFLGEKTTKMGGEKIIIMYENVIQKSDFLL